MKMCAILQYHMAPMLVFSSSKLIHFNSFVLCNAELRVVLDRIFYTYEWISDVSHSHFHPMQYAPMYDRIPNTKLSFLFRNDSGFVWYDTIQLNLCLYRNINSTKLYLFVLRVMAMKLQSFLTHIMSLHYVQLCSTWCTLCVCMHFINCVFERVPCVTATELRESSYNAKSITKTKYTLKWIYVDALLTTEWMDLHMIFGY